MGKSKEDLRQQVENSGYYVKCKGLHVKNSIITCMYYEYSIYLISNFALKAFT